MTATLAVCVGLLCAPAPVATQTPSATDPPRLVLDVERHVREIGDADVPRFRLEVIGRTPQQAFEEHLKGFDTLCGPGGGGAPTVAEMKNYRPNVISPTLFSVDVLKAIADIKKMGPDRYFLYKMTRPDGIHYILHEGRLPESQLLLPGAILDPIGAFPDRATATRAWRRMQRGFKTPVAPEIKPCIPK
jgi:hypothetical protein